MTKMFLIFSIVFWNDTVKENLISFSDSDISISTYGEVVSEEPSIDERYKVDFILDNCPGTTRNNIDAYDVLALLRLEERLNVPKEARGILPAVFCIESKLQKADNLFGDEGRALGPAQFHIAAFRTCVVSNWKNSKESHIINKYDWRRDFLFSARCWITNTMRVLTRIERECPDISDYEKWVVAEANVSNWVRYRHHGCKAKSKHFRLFEKWQESNMCF